MTIGTSVLWKMDIKLAKKMTRNGHKMAIYEFQISETLSKFVPAIAMHFGRFANLFDFLCSELAKKWLNL